MDDKRLIEETIPLEDISFESAREKSIRHGHISTLHIWWARRPLVASRAAVFGSLVIPSKISKETLKKTAEIAKRWLPEYKKIHITDEKLVGKELYHFMRVLCTWEASNNEEIINQARDIIKESHDGKTPKVLDPFAGGGSIPLEALRLGCETYANELNPVAHIIELCTLVYPQKYGKEVEIEVDEKENNGQLDLGTGSKKFKKVNRLAKDVRIWGEWVLDSVKKQLGNLYLSNSNESSVVGYLWARSVRCTNPSCRTVIPLLKSPIVAERKDNKIYLIVEPISQTDELTVGVKNENETPINWKDAIHRDSVRCKSCQQTIDGHLLRKLGQEGKIEEHLLAVIESRMEKHELKTYRPVSKLDDNLVLKAKEELKRFLLKNPEAIPNEELPYLRSIFNVNVYGIKTWGELFNKRQLLSLVIFTQKIKEAQIKIFEESKDKEYAKAVSSYLGITLDKLASFSSSFNWWQANGEFVVNVFGRQALPMIWDYVEVNPFNEQSGGWSSCLDWIIKVITELSYVNTNPANVILGDATKLRLSNSYFELVMTDPPYYDMVPFADLSDFYYVWMKRSLGTIHPEVFKTPLSPKSSEIVQLAERNIKYREKTKEYFEKKLTLSFAEANRVLAKDGLVGIMFAHKTSSAWETLINSLLKSGLLSTASWPLHTERPGRPRSHGSAALASSILITCRKKHITESGYYDQVKEELITKVKEQLDNYWKLGIRGADFFISAIGSSIGVFGKYNQVKKLTGEEVDVKEFLKLVREEVTNYALQKILTKNVGGIDAETRFYILWRWAYNGLTVPFDDARILAQAIGAEIDDLMSKSGVLKRSGENVELLGPLEIKVQKVESTIDSLHRACQLWSDGKKQELADFLNENGKIKDESFWSTAQALSEVLPDGDKEKQLLQGLLASRSGIVQAAKQGRFF